MQKLKGVKMLSALETWIDDKWYVGMVYMKQKKVAGYCSENSKSCKNKKYVQCKVRK